MPMIIMPSIDLLSGQVVRLIKGDPKNRTVYFDDPLKALEKIESDGAEWAHIVDLNGALSIGESQAELICRLIKNVKINVQVGGGIRTRQIADKILAAGAKRVVLGTAAISHKNFIKDLEITGDKIVLGLDFNNGIVMTHGWVQEATSSFNDLVAMAEAYQVAALLVTDIKRDGMLTGPNFGTYSRLQQKTSLPLIASGGVSSQDDLVRLAEMKIYAAVTGKAYYENRIDLRYFMEHSK
jgi:phosphoribosylformimino-5-aminoimidazole carboxamide ribotide isomerase